jgi:hypothetical protein
LRAVESLDEAVTHLEMSVARRERLDASRVDTDTQHDVMRDDRERLAVELDGALYRLTQLEAVARDVDARVVKAMVTIQSVLEQQT